MRPLSTTSYAILGLLALRSWSSYELAKQMTRNLQHFWPRAESNLYAEAKNLVEHGLADATKGYSGRRPRTEYSITLAGEVALQEWLGEPSRGPMLEFDGLVRVLFAEQGTKSQLRDTLASVQAETEAKLTRHTDLLRELAETGGPFPERLQVNVLVVTFLLNHSRMILQWLDWVEGVIKDWPEDIAATPTRTVRSLLDAELLLGTDKTSADEGR